MSLTIRDIGDFLQRNGLRLERMKRLGSSIAYLKVTKRDTEVTSYFKLTKLTGSQLNIQTVNGYVFKTVCTTSSKKLKIVDLSTEYDTVEEKQGYDSIW